MSYRQYFLPNLMDMGSLLGTIVNSNSHEAQGIKGLGF